MGGLDNPTHLIFLLVLPLLLVFGAKRLPEMGRSLGSGLRGFRDSLSADAAHQPASERPSVAASEGATQAAVEARAEASGEKS